MTAIENFTERYQNKFGENIETVISAQAQYDGNITMCYNRVHDLIDSYIKAPNHNPYYVYTSSDIEQQEAVLEAEIYQAFYEIHGVDFSQISGLDTNSGALIDKKTLTEREVCTRAHNILLNADLLHKPLMGFPIYWGMKQ